MPDAYFSDNQAFYSSLVVEHIVPKSQELTFKRWHDSLIKATRQQIGFVRSDDCPPLACEDGVVKWYSIVHFNSPEHLNAWIESEERKRLLKAGRKFFRAYRFKSFSTGLEGWFSTASGAEQSSLGPPVWKQILSVVLGLYPIVMLQSGLFSRFGILAAWSPASAMLLNNLITSSILTLVVMPLIVRLLSFWLRPAYRYTALKIELLGLTIVAASLIGMVIAFNRY